MASDLPLLTVALTGGKRAGKRFGRYLLLEQIGRGGMAEVFRAVTHGPGGFQRQFVVKRVRAEKSGSRDFVEMFVNEARICALLDHPNIVQVYDFGQVGGDYFLAMEYLRGKDLLGVMRRLRAEKRSLPPSLTAVIGHEVARGLHYAHHLVHHGKPLHVVHRDVTPSNIMLLASGGVKLLDFGIARASMKMRSVTPHAGVVKGKLSYLSPEQVHGQPLDGRSDIFSLGVVMWEALVGERLFYDAHDLQTMKNVLEKPIPPPSSKRPDVPTALDFILLRALDREPNKRYPDAGALAKDLDEYLATARAPADGLTLLLEDLFRGEVSRQEIVPEETFVGTAAGADDEPASGTPASANGDYATVSAIHHPTLRSTLHNRRVGIAVAGALGLACVGIGGLCWPRARTAAPADRAATTPTLARESLAAPERGRPENPTPTGTTAIRPVSFDALPDDAYISTNALGPSARGSIPH